MFYFSLLEKKLDGLVEKHKIHSVLDSCRLIHGRGKIFAGWDGINVDFFQPVLVITLYQQQDDVWFDKLTLLLNEFYQKLFGCVLIQHRYLPQSPSNLLMGELPEEIFARRGELKFKLRLNAQQNFGFFLDMEPGREWLEANCKGLSVLNLFSFTCAFSVVALKAWAQKVVNVDMSSAILNIGRENHYLNGIPKHSHEYLAENILKSWSRIQKKGPYDVVIVDPPSFQKGSFVAERDYVKIIKRLPELMPEGGLVLACLNAPELDENFLKNLFEVNLPAAEFVERLKPSRDFPDVDVNRQLKLLVYRVLV